MTKDQARRLASFFVKQGWSEVWIELGVYADDWRVSYRRLPDESPCHAGALSKSLKAMVEREPAQGVMIAPVEVLTREEAADRTRLRPSSPPPIFQGEPLRDGEALQETDLPCPNCEDEGRHTQGGRTPRLCRRENGELVCPSHGDVYAEIHEALNGRDVGK